MPMCAYPHKCSFMRRFNYQVFNLLNDTNAGAFTIDLLQYYGVGLGEYSFDLSFI